MKKKKLRELLSSRRQKEVDYNNMTKAELVEVAKQKRIELTSRATKADIIKLLEEN